MICQSLYIPLLGYSYNPLSAWKGSKILGNFPEINQKAEQMGGRGKRDQATRQFETIQVIIIEAELLFSPLQCWF